MTRAPTDYEYMTFDEFDEASADKPASERWELIGGRVVRLMVGARWEHARIVGNLAFEIEGALRAKSSRCQTFSESFYMKERGLDSQMLPDIMVVCGDLRAGATGTNEPVVLMEVMSAGSAARDRFEKWRVYQQLPTLRHYALVEQTRPHLKAFDRTGESWDGLRILDGLDAVLSLPAIDVAVPLSEIYRWVL